MPKTSGYYETIEDDVDLLEPEEVRETQIALAEYFKQYSDGIYHINELLETRVNDPKLLERRGSFEAPPG